MINLPFGLNFAAFLDRLSFRQQRRCFVHFAVLPYVKFYGGANLSNFKSLTMHVLHSSIDEAGDCASAAFPYFDSRRRNTALDLQTHNQGQTLKENEHGTHI
jgi:hypothetical protein